MKLSKVLFGSALALSLVFGFASCGEEDDDDLDMLSGSNNNYSISYTSTAASSEASRGYKTTTFKHRGALCQISIDTEKSSAGAGAVGYIWDLKDTPAKAAKAARDFFIVGANYGMTASGKVAYYVSKYSNVTDIQAKNFGTELTENKAVEKEYIKLNSTNTFTPTIGADKMAYMTVNVYEEKNDANVYTGAYVVDIYNGKVEKADLATATTIATHTIPAADVGYVDADGKATRPDQKNGAVYANVYGGKTLVANWHYADTYSAAEVVEE